MSRFVRISAVSRFALLLAVAGLPGELRGQQGQGAANDGRREERILVLQDGGVLAGRISRAGDSYVVSRGGGQMQISAANVRLECGSLDEAYNRQRQQLTHPTAGAHLALAEWCLRYDLVEQAGRELTDAKSLDARHPRLALLERRLALANQELRKPAAAASTARPPLSRAASSQARAAASEVQIRVVERFTRKVQPVLVNNCTASGCHQPGGGQPFQLDRALLHGLANRRSTMNNLAAALALVDREQPELSPLLTVPRRTHGGMVDPVIGPRQEQAYRHLVEWVAMVTLSDLSKAQATSNSEAEADLLAAEATAPSTPSDFSERAQTSEPDLGTVGGVMQTNYDENAEMRAPATQRLQFGAQVEKWQPRDPFDPEIFNRQRLARRRAAQSNAPNPQPESR